MQWHRLVGSDDDLNHQGADWRRGMPERGNVHPAALATLLRVLVRYTSTPDDCWFCLWEGWGWINPRSGSSSTVVARLGTDLPAAPHPAPPTFGAEALARTRVHHPGRDYLLLRGPAAAARFIGDQVTPEWFLPQSPNLFWPQDHAWCVGTEIDFDSTLVAGSTELINELLAAPDLEVWPVHPDHSLTFDADQVN